MDKRLTFFEGAIAVVQHLYDIRYLTICGCVILIYDLIITLSKEVHYVWNARNFWIVKFCYAVNRYGVICTTLFYLSLVIPSRRLTDEQFLTTKVILRSYRCNNSASAVIVLDIGTATFGNALVLYQLIKLWKSSKYIAWLMAVGFLIVHSVTVVYGGLTVTQLKGHVQFIFITDTIQACSVMNNPIGFRGIYIPAVLLDVYCFTLLLLNALSRPRSHTMSLRNILYGDGVVFFMTTLSMRLLNLMLNSLAPPPISVLCLNFGSSVVATAVARLFLRLSESEERLEKQQTDSMYGEESLLDNGVDYQLRRFD